MTAKRTLPLLAALAFVLLILAACGGDDNSSPTPTPSPASATPTPASTTPAPASATPLPSGATPNIDECALITPAELDQIIPGQAFAAGSSPKSDVCDFTGSSGKVTIASADLVTPEAAAQSLQTSTTHTTSNPVDGIGDAAYWQPDNSQLGIVIGRFGLIVAVSTSTGDTAKSDEAEAIARIVIPRLPPSS
jgi:hypothetical protein